MYDVLRGKNISSIPSEFSLIRFCFSSSIDTPRTSRALSKEQFSFYNTVSICLGDSNTQYLASCWDFLQNFNEIILVHDNDASGEKFARNLATRLGEYRVKIVDIPPFYEKEDGTKVKIKDLNELLFSCGKEAVVKAINEAQSTEINYNSYDNKWTGSLCDCVHVSRRG